MPRRTSFPFYEFSYSGFSCSVCLRFCRRQLLLICHCLRHLGCLTGSKSNSPITGVLMNRMFVAFNMLLLCLVITAPAHAQAGSGSISGRVTDPQGAVVPGVKVEAINAPTNPNQKSTNNPSASSEPLNFHPAT